jgi:hypothetical protein
MSIEDAPHREDAKDAKKRSGRAAELKSGGTGQEKGSLLIN